MNLTAVTKAYIFYCGLNLNALTEVETYGVAGVLYACLSKCSKSGTQSSAVADVVFDGTQATEAGELVVKYAQAEGVDAIATLVYNQLKERFPVCHFVSSKAALLSNTYEYLATQMMATPEFFDQDKAVELSAHPTDGTYLARELVKQIKAITGTELTVEQAQFVLNDYPEVTDVTSLMRAVPDIAASFP